MVSTQTIRHTEHGPRTPPLGLRFWDLVLERFINDGLLITASAVGFPGLPRIALPNLPEGFGFRTLPGLRLHDSGGGDSTPWSSFPSDRAFLIRMTDPQDRYLPLTFRATAPHPGWLTPPEEFRFASMPQGAFPLFPNPGRDFGSSYLTVRAQLWDPEENRPASWAWVRLRLQMGAQSQLTQTLADHEGRFLIALPKGRTLDSMVEVGRSAPASARLPSHAFASLELSVKYGRLSQGPVPPHFCDILAQPFAHTAGHGLLETRFSPTGVPDSTELELRSSDEPHGRVLVRRGER